MGYLDNTSITVDAILTKKGRQKLASGQRLDISKFALGDDENKDIAKELRVSHGTRLAYLGKTFALTETTMKELTGKVGAKCPENNKQIPLISTNGSACVSCGLCVYNKADIRFSASKK